DYYCLIWHNNAALF
nr:immunoglobulin light chain junction region [Macaca mulatta]MOX70130.1 immunoglobulin light chain junction region [Macaca mulatta]MOX70290.1 immunoglobulin light chain junction region [Macaca mulatta]MOX70397.1 immunoglobulin light chain junction region [Macaca mulatta]MOX71138.1 immunoglobulin light chain junction region [Macaca mulatta]